jgi:cation transport ATPase
LDELHLRHEEEHSEVKYIVAHGIASDINGILLRIGSYHFIFEDEGITIPEGEQEKFDNLPDEYSHLYLSIGGQLAAVILIEDPIKEEAKQVIHQLHDVGFKKLSC